MQLYACFSQQEHFRKRILYIFLNAQLIEEILSIRISNETIFAESNWIASDRYYSSGFIGIFNRASGKAHAHRDCPFVRNVGATIGVNNFFIAVPILSVLFLFSISAEFFAIFSVSIDLHAPAKSTMLTSFAALVQQFIIEKRWDASFGGMAGQMKLGTFYCAYYNSLSRFLAVSIY